AKYSARGSRSGLPAETTESLRNQAQANSFNTFLLPHLNKSLRRHQKDSRGPCFLDFLECRLETRDIEKYSCRMRKDKGEDVVQRTWELRRRGPEVPWVKGIEGASA
ncbi:hypothetical protein HPP92_029168, partial [Vanilla planifolia]